MTTTKVEVKQLAQLIAERVYKAAGYTMNMQCVLEIDEAVRSCQINGLVPAIEAINSEFGGPGFAQGEIKIMCAKLGVEAASGLLSVMHLIGTVEVPVGAAPLACCVFHDSDGALGSIADCPRFEGVDHDNGEENRDEHANSGKEGEGDMKGRTGDTNTPDA
jgi:hypothetical protein